VSEILKLKVPHSTMHFVKTVRTNMGSSSLVTVLMSTWCHIS